MFRAVRSRLLPGTGSRRRLVIALHGCTWISANRAKQLDETIRVVRDLMPDADIFAPLLPIEFWSLESADDIVGQLLAEVDRIWDVRSAAGSEYEDLVLIGFSFGSVLLRQMFCRAAGAREDGTVEPLEARPWHARATRMVLLAGLNRGWTTDSPVSRIESLWTNLGTAVGHVLPREPALFAIRRGAPFLTRTRLQWLELERAGRTPAMTVQLLGTRDDIVSPADNLDLATGARFVYLEVPRSGHFDVVSMGTSSPDGDIRRARFALALLGSAEALDSIAVTGPDLLQMLPSQGDVGSDIVLNKTDGHSLDDVVFVVHGIRDKGYWTRKIARVAVTVGRETGRNVVALAPTYGYFAMLPFLLPWRRRAKIEWMLDLYVTVRARHPEAAISFIGHSNGTYILAGALASCRAVRFENVVFAGSVVRSDYPWSSCIERGQVRRVLNYVATSDWVVAIFPRLLQVLRLQDLGGAGHDGFDNSPQNVTNIEYVAGRHSAALDEQHWTDIARFVLGGRAPREEVKVRSPWIVAGAHVAALVWLMLAAFVVIPTYLMLLGLGFPELTHLGILQSWTSSPIAELPPWSVALGLLAWIRLVAAGLTRL